MFNSSMMTTEAPEDMPEGFVFQTQCRDRSEEPCVVEIPPGGIQRGQSIPVPHPTTVLPLRPPRGRWRHGLFAFWDATLNRILMASLPCTACCFLGQLLQRHRLNVLGERGSTTRTSTNRTSGHSSNSDRPRTCQLLGCLWFMIQVVCVVVGVAVPPFFAAGQLAIGAWLWLAGVCLRHSVRRQYNIPASFVGRVCCDHNSFCDDCCCMFWCGWFNLIQISRQSHHEGAFPYHTWSRTGLRDSMTAMDDGYGDVWDDGNSDDDDDRVPLAREVSNSIPHSEQTDYRDFDSTIAAIITTNQPGVSAHENNVVELAS